MFCYVAGMGPNYSPLGVCSMPMLPRCAHRTSPQRGAIAGKHLPGVDSSPPPSIGGNRPRAEKRFSWALLGQGGPSEAVAPSVAHYCVLWYGCALGVLGVQALWQPAPTTEVLATCTESKRTALAVSVVVVGCGRKVMLEYLLYATILYVRAGCWS